MLLVNPRMILRRPYIAALTLAKIRLDRHYLVQPGREVTGSIRGIALCYVSVEKGNFILAIEIRCVDAQLCLGIGTHFYHIEGLQPAFDCQGNYR